MKPLYWIIALLLILSPMVSPVRADYDGDKDPQKMEEMHQKWQQKRLERMTQKLALSPDQQASVKTALDDQNAKMTDLHKQMQTIHEDTENKITALLNDDQKTKYAAMREEMKKKREEGGKEHHRMHKKD